MTRRTPGGAAAAAVLLLLAPACATIVHGPDQAVLVESEPSGAPFETSQGHRGTTPERVVVERGKPLEVRFQFEGAEPYRLEVERGMSPAVWGDVAWALAGLIPTAIAWGVDWGNGSVYRYPDRVGANLEARAPLDLEPPTPEPKPAPRATTGQGFTVRVPKGA